MIISVASWTIAHRTNWPIIDIFIFWSKRHSIQNGLHRMNCRHWHPSSLPFDIYISEKVVQITRIAQYILRCTYSVFIRHIVIRSQSDFDWLFHSYLIYTPYFSIRIVCDLWQFWPQFCLHYIGEIVSALIEKENNFERIVAMLSLNVKDYIELRCNRIAGMTYKIKGEYFIC